MASGQSSSDPIVPFVPQELRARCVISAVSMPNVAMLGGTYARDRPQADPADNLSSSFYYSIDNPNYQQPKPLAAQRLRTVSQASGGMMPLANDKLGAPMCTFLYGGIKPTTAHDQLSLIQGPDSSIIGLYGSGYNPTFARDANLGGRQGVDPTDSDTFSKAQYSFLGSQCPFIPSVGDAPFNDAEVRPTFNIWQASYSTDVTALYQYVGNLGPVLLSTADPEEVRKIAVVRQNVTVDGRCQIMVNAAPNKEVVLQRIFPISYDLAYSTYQDSSGNNNQVGTAMCSLYYPYDAVAQAENLETTYRPIRAQGGDNCGFQVHFSVAQPGNLQNPNSGEVNASIELDFGAMDVTPPANGDVPDKLQRFKIKLIPGQKPQLAFWHPALQQFSEVKIKGPIFCPNSKASSYSVYVHFAGAVMLVGFSPEVDLWNAVLPIKADPTVDDFSKLYVPWIPNDSFITATFKGLHASMEYGPAAFNNYNAENVVANDETSDLSYITSNFAVPDDQKDTISDVNINKYLTDNRFRNSTVDNPDDITGGVSFYGDWRRIYDTDEAEITYSSTITPQTQNNIKYAIAMGEVQFDTTIEGPLFFKVRNQRGAAATTLPKLTKAFKSWSDITPYLKAFEANYDMEGTNRSYLAGTCTVKLFGLHSTQQGNAIGTLLRENCFVITVMAGYGELNTFFKGVVQDYEVQYNLDGTTELNLSLRDIGNELVDGLKFPQHIYFAGMTYRNILPDVFALGGLQDYFEIQDEPLDDSADTTKFDAFNQALDAALGEATLELSRAQDAVHGKFGFPLEGVLKSVMELVRQVDGFSVLHIDPEQERWYVHWREDPTFLDSLTVLGVPDENGEFSNLAEQGDGTIHGVMAGPYHERTHTSLLHPNYIVQSVDFLGEPIYALGTNPTGYDPTVLTTIDDAITNGQPFDEFGYVGFLKTFMDVSLQGNLLTQVDLNNAATLLKDILYHSNHNWTGDVYVTKPLNHFGQFNVATIVAGDASADSSSDNYFYKSTKYSYTKERNYITANITGERFSLSNYKE